MVSGATKLWQFMICWFRMGFERFLQFILGIPSIPTMASQLQIIMPDPMAVITIK
jgi:hypothetical protein